VTAVARDDGTILVSFTPPAPIDGVRVYRAASPMRLVATLPAGATSYLDSDTEVGHGYTYRLVAFRGDAESPDCGTHEVTAIPEFGSAWSLGLALVGGVAAVAWPKRRRR
jgi:hypothetical protein